MSSTPSLEELARELCDRTGECGEVKGDLICTQPKGHVGGHMGRPIRDVIPFE